MNRNGLIAGIAAGVVIGAAIVWTGDVPPAFADKVVTFASSRVKVENVTARSLPDGGCSVDVCASVKQVDGGQGYSSCTEPVEIAPGTAQTRCLSIISSADALWRSREGL